MDEMVSQIIREIFKSMSGAPDEEKMQELFQRIEVGRGYKISVELNMTYRQFCTEWNVKDFLETLPAI